MPDASAILRTSEHLRRAHDKVHGGIGARPKFPQPSLYRLLLRSHRRTGDERYLWLNKMLAVGIGRFTENGLGYRIFRIN